MGRQIIRTITPAQVRELLDYDPATGELRWRPRQLKWFNTKYAGKLLKAQVEDGYLRTYILGKKYRLHRLAWAHYYGMWPSGEIDHENGVRSDNRINNMRDATTIQNQRNRRFAPSTAFIGVRLERGKWETKIGRSRIGRFGCFGQAVTARRNAERNLGYHRNHGYRA